MLSNNAFDAYFQKQNRHGNQEEVRESIRLGEYSYEDLVLLECTGTIRQYQNCNSE